MIKIKDFHFPNNFAHITKLIATIKSDNTIPELEEFISNGVRLFHINFAVNTKDEINQILLKLETTISNYHMQNSRYMLPIGKIFEIRGRISRVGRMLHNCPIRLKSKQKIVLTSDRSYEKCCLKEVTFVSNFEPYIPRLKFGDFIFINGKTIQLYVIKITGCHVTCCVLQKAKLMSYDEVILPFYTPESSELTNNEIEDIDYAINNKCDFLLAPLVTRPEYYTTLRSHIKGCVKLISCIDVYIQSDMNITTSIIQNFDGIWIKNLQANQEMKFAIDFAKSRQKFSIANWRDAVAEIGLNPNQINMVDCIAFDNKNYLKNILDTIQKNHESKMSTNPYERSRVSFRQNDPMNIILKCAALSAGTLNAKAIICFPKTESFVQNLMNLKLHCVIIAVVMCPHKAKHFNILRNVFSLVYPTALRQGEDDSTEFPHSQFQSKLEKKMKFATKFGRDAKWINVGDVVVFCFESDRGVLEPDTIRLTFIADDKIVFCK